MIGNDRTNRHFSEGGNEIQKKILESKGLGQPPKKYMQTLLTSVFQKTPESPIKPYLLAASLNTESCLFILQTVKSSDFLVWDLTGLKTGRKIEKPKT